MNKKVRGPVWIKPALETERGEFQRTAESFGLKVAEMMKAAEKGEIIQWPFTAWNKLENSDSFDTGTEATADSAVSSYGRDTSSIKSAFATGSGLPAPIVWQRQDGTYYLIAGNTRLMVARALGVRPRVFLFRY